MGATRLLTAASILLVYSAIAGKKLLLKKEEISILAATGLLQWFGGNGLVIWAEQRLDSGLAALLLASTPIWAAVFQSSLAKRRPSYLLILSLTTGFAGIWLLLMPVMRTGVSADLLSILALLVASVSWTAGSLLQRRTAHVSPILNSGYQQLFGAVVFLFAMYATNEPPANPTTEAWLAWAYLLTFGSLIAFTAFIQALRKLPTNVVMTYGYVNPVIAIILGHLLLHEAITTWTIVGTVLVLLGVAGVYRDQ